MKPNHARKVSEQAFNQLVEAVEAGKSHKLIECLKAMGRYVKRNEKGIAIMAPIIWRRKVMPANDEEDGPNHQEETVLTFKTAYVFDISQTDGKPLPDFARVNGGHG